MGKKSKTQPPENRFLVYTHITDTETGAKIQDTEEMHTPEPMIEPVGAKQIADRECARRASLHTPDKTVVAEVWAVDRHPRMMTSYTVRQQGLAKLIREETLQELRRQIYEDSRALGG